MRVTYEGQDDSKAAASHKSHLNTDGDSGKLPPAALCTAGRELDCLSLSSLHVGLVRDLPPPGHPKVFILSCWSQLLSIIEVSVLPDM